MELPDGTQNCNCLSQHSDYATARKTGKMGLEFPQHPTQVVVSCQLSFSFVHVKSGQVVKLTTHLYPLPRIGRREAILPIPHGPTLQGATQNTVSSLSFMHRRLEACISVLRSTSYYMSYVKSKSVFSLSIQPRSLQRTQSPVFFSIGPVARNRTSPYKAKWLLCVPPELVPTNPIQALPTD